MAKLVYKCDKCNRTHDIESEADKCCVLNKEQLYLAYLCKFVDVEMGDRLYEMLRDRELNPMSRKEFEEMYFK